MVHYNSRELPKPRKTSKREYRNDLQLERIIKAKIKGLQSSMQLERNTKAKIDLLKPLHSYNEGLKE
jgi:hypothetical protein